jgi:hypothetical protein
MSTIVPYEDPDNFNEENEIIKSDSLFKSKWDKFKLRFFTKGCKTLWILIPLLILIEISITLPLENVHPDHELNIIYFCSGCNLNSGTLISSLNTADYSCIEASILGMIGESFEGFMNNYLSSLLGHILTVYALINTQDSTIHSNVGTKEMLHIVAYVLLFIDMVLELEFLREIALTDPDNLTLDS